MIRVNSRYVIDVDPQNYTAQVDLKRKTPMGIPIRRNIGYYSTLYGAIKGIAENECREQLAEGEMSLADAIAKTKAVYEEFERLFEKMVGKR